MGFAAWLFTIMSKTRKSIAKRFKVTASGKILRRKPGHRHLLRRKSQKQKRAMRQDHPASEGLRKQIAVALPREL